MSAPVLRLPSPALAMLLAAGISASPTLAAAERATHKVVLVTIDGLRWQEVVAGADPALVASVERDAVRERLEREYLEGDERARREALMPFLWRELVPRGQLIADHRRGPAARVANGKNFSYPGYSELLTGHGDPHIDSNDKVTNPNVTVLEWLSSEGTVDGPIGVVASWDVFPWIVAAERSGLFVNAGWQPLALEPPTERQRRLDELMMATPAEWPTVRFDGFTFYAALDWLDRHQPRVLYLALGEPDDWAHAADVERYLDSTRRCDALIARLWRELQQREAYRGSTTLIVSTDHGRGRTAADWTRHGADIPGAEEAWIAVLGPDTPALGLRGDVEVTLGQVAATVAALLGADWTAAEPRAAAPLPVIELAPAAAPAAR